MTQIVYLRNRVARALHRHLQQSTPATAYWLNAWVRLLSRHDAAASAARTARLRDRIARLPRIGGVS